MLHLRRDDDGGLQTFFDRLKFALLAFELLTKFVNLSLSGPALDGLDDLMGLAIEGLA